MKRIIIRDIFKQKNKIEKNVKENPSARILEENLKYQFLI